MNDVKVEGMTLRDWFAGNSPVTFDVAERVYGGEPHLSTDIDRAAFLGLWTFLQYEYADAMLTTRSEGQLRNEAQADCGKSAERLEALEAENYRLKAEVIAFEADVRERETDFALKMGKLEARAERAEKYAEHLLQTIIFLLKRNETAWRTVERKFYRSEWPVSKLLEARHGGLVTDEGEAWRYVYSGKDGTGGEYDLLRRREPCGEREGESRE